jgi:aminopeptidase-like protein
MEHLAKELEDYFDRLWPLNRSITGIDYRKSLEILNEVMPTRNDSFKTGEKVLDWEIPKEWNVKSEYLICPDGRKIADFHVNNLHLLGYSIPFQSVISFSELKEHLYTIPEQPEAIPYVTSYYKERWGFCISYNEYLTLTEGNYQVYIDSSLTNGTLITGEAIIKGKSEKEVFFSTYLCHPSMANNELSGPLVLSFLYRELLKKQKELNYTYRFIVIPETIGAIAYLSKFGKFLKENTIAGYQITCIGDSGEFTYKMSRQGNSVADRAAICFMNENNQSQILPFNPAIGSDERQWCSPGFNLPVGSLMRTMYTKFPEYHTSLDNKDFIDFEAMANGVYAYLDIINYIENNYTYINLEPYGEPQLGRRGLFRSTSDKKREDDELAMWWLLNYADGEHDLLEIAQLSSCKMDSLIRVARNLEKSGLISKKANE